MKTFTITFTARLVGAIGKKSKHREKVQAENQDQAVLKLYDKFEHVQIISIK